MFKADPKIWFSIRFTCFPPEHVLAVLGAIEHNRIHYIRIYEQRCVKLLGCWGKKCISLPYKNPLPFHVHFITINKLWIFKCTMNESVIQLNTKNIILLILQLKRHCVSWQENCKISVWNRFTFYLKKNIIWFICFLHVRIKCVFKINIITKIQKK